MFRTVSRVAVVQERDHVVTAKQSLEFSRPVLVRSLRDARPEAPREIVVTATPDECVRIAHRLGLPQVASLSCRYALCAGVGGAIVAEGALSARVSQSCVLTLDVFEDVVGERFTLRFVPEHRFDPEAADDLEASDEIPFEGDAIDLGEATVEQLALALDPWPRKPDATRPDYVITEEEAEALAERDAEDPQARRNPFGALAKLRRGDS